MGKIKAGLILSTLPFLIKISLSIACIKKPYKHLQKSKLTADTPQYDLPDLRGRRRWTQIRKDFLFQRRGAENAEKFNWSFQNLGDALDLVDLHFLD